MVGWCKIMLSDEEKKYYHKINNLDIALEETNHKYIMIHQWSKDKSHKWGIAVFNYDKDEYYWYLKTYGNFRGKICKEFTRNYNCTIAVCLKEFYSLLEKE